MLLSFDKLRMAYVQHDSGKHEKNATRLLMKEGYGVLKKLYGACLCTTSCFGMIKQEIVCVVISLRIEENKIGYISEFLRSGWGEAPLSHQAG